MVEQGIPGVDVPQAGTPTQATLLNDQPRRAGQSMLVLLALLVLGVFAALLLSPISDADVESGHGEVGETTQTAAGLLPG